MQIVILGKIGFGTYKLKGKKCQKSIEIALEVGYRHIDTADRYHNHKEVGRAIKNSGIQRSEIFLTSKLWHTDLAYDDVLTSCARFLDELQTDYLDLLLIHWPNPNIPVAKTLEAMETLKSKGLIKAIGVSNFQIDHLKPALETKVEILNNQVEFHPSHFPKDLKVFCDSNSIKLTAYSPLAQGQDLKLLEVSKLARKYNRSPAQIVLNWITQKNVVPIPRSDNEKHIKDNFKAIEWEMDPDDVKLLDNIEQQPRIFNYPY